MDVVTLALAKKYTDEALKTGGGSGGGGAVSAVDVSFDNSATGMAATDTQTAIEELFTDVSEGKALIAEAVTGMGVETASDDTFETMANNVLAIAPKVTYGKSTLSVTSGNTGAVYLYPPMTRITGISSKQDVSDVSDTTIGEFDNENILMGISDNYCVGIVYASATTPTMFYGKLDYSSTYNRLNTATTVKCRRVKQITVYYENDLDAEALFTLQAE